MASDPAVTLSDGQVTCEPVVSDGTAGPRALSWRVLRLSTHAELGMIHLTAEAHEAHSPRARIDIDVDPGANTATVHGLAQAVRLTSTWAFATWDLAVITWLGPTEATVRSVVNEAGFRVHALAHRASLDGPAGPEDAWYGDLTPRDTRDASRRPLTVREHHVLTGMARGRSNQQIAADLGISENTVKNHVRSILEVLQAPSRTAAVIEALRSGLVSLESNPQ
jgi:DNA-binding CsgD family transcriptional regulator